MLMYVGMDKTSSIMDCDKIILFGKKDINCFIEETTDHFTKLLQDRLSEILHFEEDENAVIFISYNWDTDLWELTLDDFQLEEIFDEVVKMSKERG